MPHTVSQTRWEMPTYADVEISPATTTRPVVRSVSHATRPWGSSAMMASRTASEIWSAILSGWPSVTDSELNVQLLTGRRLRRLPVRTGTLSHWLARFARSLHELPSPDVSPVDDGVEHESRHRSFVHQ